MHTKYNELFVLHSFFKRYTSFSLEDAQKLLSKCNVLDFKKGKHLLKNGTICRHNFFILKGISRTYYTDTNGREQTVQFAIENWWVTHLESFVKETPSNVSIQALEDLTALCLTKENLDQLYDEIPGLDRAFRMIRENMLIAVQRRSEFFMKAEAEEKYLHISEKLPQLVDRVPLYIIASYLEMTPEHLSTIRKKLQQSRS